VIAPRPFFERPCWESSQKSEGIIMSRLSEQALAKVADEIAPYVEEEIEKEGQLSRGIITRLAYLHASHSISSERSCRIVDEYLCQ
jgi:hypothetical protein